MRLILTTVTVCLEMNVLDALGAPELRDALLYVRSSPRPVCGSELAAAQRVHPNVARARLARLAEAGLLVSRLERLSGRSGPGAGRPARVYWPAPETSAIEFPTRRYEDLIGLLAACVPNGERLGETGAAYAGRLLADAPLEPAEELATGLERVCASLGRLGFQAGVAEADEQSGVIATTTCPLRPLVVEHPDTAPIDCGLWRGLVGAALAEGEVRCETRGCLDADACRVLVRVTP
jgi:predicted ArsR family transcriptional regulator